MNFGESAKPRGLRGNMGYVGAWVAWVTWVKILFYVVHDFCVGCVGQICFCVGLCLCQNILRGSSFFHGSAFTYQMRLFYYTNSLGIFLRESLPSKSWPNPVFLRGLLEICKIDNTQWHFYERVTKFYLWAANWPYSQSKRMWLQSNLLLIPDSPSLFWKFYRFMETFWPKKLSERMLYHAVNRDFRLLYSYTRISNISYKINYDGQSRQVFS